MLWCSFKTVRQIRLHCTSFFSVLKVAVMMMNQVFYKFLTIRTFFTMEKLESAHSACQIPTGPCWTPLLLQLSRCVFVRTVCLYIDPPHTGSISNMNFGTKASMLTYDKAIPVQLSPQFDPSNCVPGLGFHRIWHVCSTQKHTQDRMNRYTESTGWHYSTSAFNTASRAKVN